MASGTFQFYGKFFQSAFNKELDFDSDTIKVMLCSSSYTPNKDTHQYKSDVNNEVTGTNWSAGGVTVSGCSVAINAAGATKYCELKATDVTASNVTLTGARIAVFYDSSPASDATRPLIGYIDFGSDLSPNAGTLTIDFDASTVVGRVAY